MTMTFILFDISRKNRINERRGKKEKKRKKEYWYINKYIYIIFVRRVE